MYNNFNSALLQLGDVRDWALSVENDLDSISSSLEFIINTNNSNVIQKP